ncbi:unnamed protein product [Candida verbasci]|uniref:Uncharacterized protein n=1 Tax=Candida verbasci TaxID=1227364 RepID=A0A9W4XJM5_9ASCO|nr:unnamed protein product [Candida verbasci]
MIKDNTNNNNTENQCTCHHHHNNHDDNDSIASTNNNDFFNNNDLNSNFDKYVENFDKLLSNIGIITNSIFDISKETSKELNEKYKQFSKNYFTNNDDDQYNNNNFDNYKYNYPSFYRSTFDVLQNFSPQDGLKLLNYYNHKSPTITQYHKCLDSNGISIWDEFGFWRCLFPQSNLNNDLLNFKNQYFKDKILTKEDFLNKVKQLEINENDKIIDLEKSGKWFKSFDEFLKFKHDKFSKELVAKQRKRNEQEQIQNTNNKNTTTTTTTNNNNNNNTSSKNNTEVVSTSIQSNMFTDLDNKEIKLIESKKECFSNGDCNIIKMIKSKPIGSKDWINIEECRETLTNHSSSSPSSFLDNNDNDSNSNSNSNSNKGWFWNK